jgi:chromosome partitioning protein
MATIAIANHKGGVGKTTTAVNLAACLARAGEPTLLLDADAQAHSTYFFVDDVTEVEADLQDVIVGHVPAEKVILPTRIDSLELLPATLALAELDMQLVPMTRREDQVRLALDPLASRYRYIVVDLPPNLAPLTLASLAAATHIIVPVSATRFAMAGLGTFLGWAQEFRRQNVITAPLLGVLLTMFDRRTRVAADVQNALQEAASQDGLPLFETVIPRRIGMEDQVADRLVAGDSGAHDELQTAYQAFSSEVLRKTGGSHAR